MTFWSLDLGSCNSAIARWNEVGQHPEMVHMPAICREQEGKIEVKYSIPSAIYPHAPRGWQDRLGAWPFLEKRLLMGRQALIGRAAVEEDLHQRGSGYVHGFKQALLRNSYESLGRLGQKQFPPQQVARLFLRELKAEVQLVSGERLRDLTIGTPVDCYEVYRAQLGEICHSLGINRPRFIDEPVAAALGYGINSGQNAPVLVLDFGAGTLDLALISMASSGFEQGHCKVLAKAGVAVGGSHVDSWVLERFCEQRAFDFRPLSDPTISWWFRAMLEEARAVKERLFFEESTHFYADPPESLRNFDALIKGQQGLHEPFAFSRQDLVDILEERGLMRMLESCLAQIMADAAVHGISEKHIGDVLMVGGSSLLPGVYPLMERYFGRDKVRAWQPFHAVAFGGSVFASGNMNKSDFITHDYAFLTYNAKTHEPEHQVIIPRGTVFPTTASHWKRQLTPTCALGEPEKVFKMVICEMGRRHQLEQEFSWDMQGRLFRSDGAGKEELVVALNEENPALGFLDPPHSPADRAARLEIGFGVNKERWLTATVFDLKTRKQLMNETPVIRLK